VGTKSNAATFVLASVRKNGDTRSFDSSCVAMCVCVCVCVRARVCLRAHSILFRHYWGFPDVEEKSPRVCVTKCCVVVGGNVKNPNNGVHVKKGSKVFLLLN